MDDPNAKRRLVLTAAIHTIASACRHLYEDEIEAAKARGDVMAVVKAKARMQKDWDKWTAPLEEDLKALDVPPLVMFDAAG